jgi:16S rRNA processing protein RimM
LVGQSVFVPSKRLPDGEYYWKDVIGLDIVTEDGRRLGYVKTILPTGSNDVYVCNGDEGEILIPALDDVIRKIDIGKGLMVVRLPEGL